LPPLALFGTGALFHRKPKVCFFPVDNFRFWPSPFLAGDHTITAAPRSDSRNAPRLFPDGVLCCTFLGRAFPSLGVPFSPFFFLGSFNGVRFFKVYSPFVSLPYTTRFPFSFHPGLFPLPLRFLAFFPPLTKMDFFFFFP